MISIHTEILSQTERDMGDGVTHIVAIAKINKGRFSVRSYLAHNGCEPFELGTTIYPTKSAAEYAFHQAQEKDFHE